MRGWTTGVRSGASCDAPTQPAINGLRVDVKKAAYQCVARLHLRLTYRESNPALLSQQDLMYRNYRRVASGIDIDLIKQNVLCGRPMKITAVNFAIHSCYPPLGRGADFSESERSVRA